MREINKLYDTFGHSQPAWQEAIAKSKATYGKLGRVKLVFTLPDNSTVAVSKRQIEKIAKEAVKSSNEKFTEQLRAESEQLTGIKKLSVNLREKISQLFGKSVNSFPEDGFENIILEEELEVKSPVASRNGTQSELEKALNPFTNLCSEYDVPEATIKEFLSNCNDGSTVTRLAIALENQVSDEPSKGQPIKAAIRESLLQVENNPSFEQAALNLKQILTKLGD